MTIRTDPDDWPFTRHSRARRFRAPAARLLEDAGQPPHVNRLVPQTANSEGGEPEQTPAPTPPRIDASHKPPPGDELDAAEQAKSAFLSCVSHELRTPLTSILCGLSLVLDDLAESPAQAHQLIQVAYVSGQRLEALIDELLEMSSLEAGRLQAYLRPVTVGPMLDEVSGFMRPNAKRKGLRLDCQVADPGTMVQADPRLLRQILVCLLGNALKFTAAGAVTLRELMAGNRMELIVADTGIGIAPDIQASLFQPFVQADNSTTRRHGGLGLGLSLARRLTELMNGSLTLRSAGEGQGSAFIVSLPLASDRDMAAHSHAAQDK